MDCLLQFERIKQRPSYNNKAVIVMIEAGLSEGQRSMKA